MANFKRSKSIDFTLPVRSSVFPQDFDYEQLKNSKSCPNIELEVIQNSDTVEDSTEWYNVLKGMIDSWVQKVNKEMQKTELQVMCLEDLHVHYSQQNDVMTKKNISLSNELLFCMEKLKTEECILNNEKIRQELLTNQLEYSQSLYKESLFKNKIVLQDVRKYAENYNDVVDEQTFLQDQYNLYESKNIILVKLINEKKDLVGEKIRMQNTFKFTEITWEKELKNIYDHKATLQAKYNGAIQNYETICDNIKQIQNDINNVLIIQNKQKEDRKNIIKDIKDIEEIIQNKKPTNIIINHI